MRKSVTQVVCIFMVCTGAVRAGAKDVLSWRDCVAMAKRSNPALRSALEKIHQGRDDVGIALSPYLPQIGASLGAARKGADTGPQGAQRLSYGTGAVMDYLNRGDTYSESTNYSVGLSGRQMVFDGLKTVYEVRSAKDRAGDAVYQYMTVSSGVRLRLRTAYVQLMKAQMSRRILSEIAARRKTNLALVNVRYQAGLEHRGSLLNARANLSQAESDLLQAERAVVVAQKGLMKEMGAGMDGAIRVSDDMPEVICSREEPDFVAIAREHPLVLGAAAKKESALSGKKAAIAGFSPAISVTGSAARSDTRLPLRKSEWSVGVECTVPIFDGARTIFNIRKSSAQVRQTRADELDTRESVLLALEQKWIDLRNSLESADVQGKFLKSAEERAKIAGSQYSIGLILFDNWSIIEDDLARMKKSLLDARANALIAEAAWIQAQGGTLDYGN